MSDIKCGAKHTAYNPTDEKWRCPQCGCSDGGMFYIEEATSSAHQCCPRLHDADWIVCHECEWAGSGKTLAKRLMALDHVETCPTCRGKGVVPAKD